MPLTGIDANLQTGAVLSADMASEYIKDDLLDRPEKLTVFWGLAEKATLPKGSGKTVQWNRYERLGLPASPLEDGVTPVGLPLAISTVQAVIEQWGAWVGLSDMAQLTVQHPVLQEVKSLLNLQHKETLDREALLPLLGSSSVYYANGKTSRANLTSSDVATTDDIRRMVASLRQAGARYYKGKAYAGVHDPYVEGDFSKDSTFVSGATQSQVDRLNEFVTSSWMGGEWMRSNLIPIISLMPANWATQAADTTAIAGATLFTLGQHVLTKTTYLDPESRIETVIEAESDVTNAAAFSVIVTISGANAPSGIYYVYSTLVGAAPTPGTGTRQVRINHTAGTDSVVKLVMGGAPTPLDTFVVTGTGAVAPATPPSGVNVHTTLLLGKGAFGVVTLGGLETTMTERKATDSDPLAQRTKVGWKQPLKGVVLNPAFFKRMESASAYN